MDARVRFLYWSVPAKELGLFAPYNKVTVLGIESLAGKRRVFVPGRRSTPIQVRRMHERIVAYAVRALLMQGWNLRPEKMIGISILTEGAGVPFFEAFNRIWLGKQIGGCLHVWARRKMTDGPTPDRSMARFQAEIRGIDNILQKNPIKGATGLIFDIGATGATLETVVPAIAPMFESLIFSSPCTSIQAARKFIETAVLHGIEPERLAVVANEGFFGLFKNGTFLSLQLPGTITSTANKILSKEVYPDSKAFCHIGAGGWAANWPRVYQRELGEDEKELGKLPRFNSLEQVLRKKGLFWPKDFGQFKGLDQISCRTGLFWSNDFAL